MGETKPLNIFSTGIGILLTNYLYFQKIISYDTLCGKSITRFPYFYCFFILAFLLPR